MIKSQFSVVILFVVLASLVSFAGCAPNAPGNNNATIAVATPEPTPDKAAIQTELTRIENDWARIIKERDGATVRRIEADDVVIIYPDGALGTKEEDSKDIESGMFTFDSWETSDVKVNVIDKDSAVVTLRYTVKNARIKSSDGRVMDVSGQYLSLDTFARRNDQWQFVGLSTVKVQSPVTTASPVPGASPSVSNVVPPRPIPSPRVSPVIRSTPVPRPSVPRPSPSRVVATPVKTP